MDKIIGKNILIVGDLHISDIFSGKHIDYMRECEYALQTITDKVNSVKPAALILLGDIVGWNETNIRNRGKFVNLCKYFMSWNDICPVYSVRGNHDLRGYPDFDALHDLGLIKISEDCDGIIDFYTHENDEVPQIRYHIVDYGAENKTLDIYKGNKDNVCSNAVLGHNSYIIEGVTNWFETGEQKIVLNQLRNFKDVDIVISGHIHNPSPEIYETNMTTDNICSLFYPGCPTRPVKDNFKYDNCWFVNCIYDEESNAVIFNPEIFTLLPYDEVFNADENYITQENTADIAEKVRKEALANVLGDLTKYQVASGDIITQINNIPNASEEAKQLAVTYIEKALA